MNISRRSFIAATGSTVAVTLASRPLLSLTRAFASPVAPHHNIVIIMTDDQDTDSMGVMRHLMSFPRGSWINFTNAICNDGICAPSRASFLTGLYTRHHKVYGNPYAKQFVGSETLPVWLRNAGYRTALFGKYLFSFGKVVGVPPGWDIFQELEIGYPGLAANVGQLAVDFIRETTEPFYLHVAPRDPHTPAIPQEQYASASVWLPPDPPSIGEDTSDKVSWVHMAQELMDPPAVLHAERTRAHQAMLGVDDMVMAIIEALEARGILENTVICYMSDNGFLWGEHGLARKHWHFEEVIRIPMLIRYPGVEGNREENRVVRVVDLAQTFTEIAGTTPGKATDGRSLRPIIESPWIDDERSVLLEKYPDGQLDFSFTGVRIAGWVYVEFHNGEKEMYDLAADPYQLENLAGRMAYAQVEAQLRDEMLALLSMGGEPTPTSTATVTPTATPSPTPTATPSSTPTATPTPGGGHCHPPVPGNAIQNPGFEKGRLKWIFITNGKGKFAITKQDSYECAKAARITSMKACSIAQLVQKGVRLKPATDYRLSFAARSTTGREIAINLASGKPPSLNYGILAAKFPLAPSWKVYVIDFTTTGFTRAVANGQLSMSLASPTEPGEVYDFDDFVLVTR